MNRDEIHLFEVQWTLKLSKNMKACGINNLNAELFKYGLPLKEYYTYNMWWKQKIPLEWSTAIEKPIFKEREVTVKIIEALAY
jgi:hypothetical protein